MRIVTVSNVRDKVQKLFPNLAPFELKKDKLDELVENLKETQDIRYLRFLKQQAVLAEGISCLRRNEPVIFLNTSKVWR